MTKWGSTLKQAKCGLLSFPLHGKERLRRGVNQHYPGFNTPTIPSCLQDNHVEDSDDNEVSIIVEEDLSRLKMDGFYL